MAYSQDESRLVLVFLHGETDTYRKCVLFCKSVVM